MFSGEYSSRGSSEDTINDFASNGFDPTDDMFSGPRIDIRNGYNKYSFIEQKKSKPRKMVSVNSVLDRSILKTKRVKLFG